MASSLSFWLATISFVYPLALMVSLFPFIPHTWWFVEHPVFMGIILPVYIGVVLLIAKLNRAKVAWVTVFAFPLWIVVVNWVYIWVLLEIAAGC